MVATWNTAPPPSSLSAKDIRRRKSRQRWVIGLLRTDYCGFLQVSNQNQQRSPIKRGDRRQTFVAIFIATFQFCVSRGAVSYVEILVWE